MVMKNEKLLEVVKKSQKEFIRELIERLNQVMVDYFLYCNKKNPDSLAKIKQFFHTIRGTAVLLNFQKLSEISTKYEEFIFENTGKAELPLLLLKIAEGIGELYEECKGIGGNAPDSDEMSGKSVTEACVVSKNGESVLVVDQDTVFLQKMKELFEGEGYTFFSTSKSVEVADLIKLNQIDLVLLGTLIHGEDGFKLYDRIEREGLNIKVLFIAEYEVIEELLNISKLDYVKKTFSDGEMIAKVEEALKIEHVTRSGNILIVNEDTILLKFVREALEDQGFQVTTTSKMEDVEKILKKNNIHLMILDVFMFEQNGFSVFKQIREEYRDLPVVFITGDPMEESFKDNLYDYIKKPFFIQELFSKSDEILQRVYHTLDLKESSLLKDNASSAKKRKPISKPVATDERDISTLDNYIEQVLHKKDFHQGQKKPEKKKILLIDGENATKDLIYSGLSEANYEINHIPDGEKAFEKCSELIPDLVILNLLLPKANGFTVLGEIKKHEETKDIKIIVLSSGKKEEDMIKCFASGVDDYILKPFTVSELEMKIKKLLDS